MSRRDLDLPDMYARVRGHAAPEGDCGHIRQITTAHVTYTSGKLKIALVYIGKDGTFDYGIRI